MRLSRSFYYVRHGESEANAKSFRSGQMDISLTEKGCLQAQHTADVLALASPKPERIVTSPLSRALETASIINRVLNLPLREDAGLMEQNYGELQGRALHELREIYGDDDDRSPPGGETFNDFQNRILTTLNDVLESPGGLPLIVGHGGMMNALREYLRLPYEKTPNGGAFFFDHSSGQLKPFSLIS